MDKSTTCGSVDGNGDFGNHTSSIQNPEEQPVMKNTGERKNYKRAANRGRKPSRGSAGGEGSWRASNSTARVLRSRSAANNTPNDSVHTIEQPAKKESTSEPVHSQVQRASERKKRGRTANTGPKDDLSKIRKQVRYILNRMSYEQSLLEAYASEGWKRQSVDKIRPEKELQRAKEEILRCKLRIRESFQNLDHLLSVGKLENFDAEGEISHEDMFCAICHLQNVTLNNDIILCDGVCDRGFHQNCLNPPLRTEDIPAGDEGWLCPACVCKIDCIDVINELQGTKLSISDSWEKVFPEADALAHGSKKNDVSDLPSDDSEDNDFDPDIVEEHVAGHEEGSSEEDGDEDSDSDDSNFITSLDNSEHLKDKGKVDDLGLPSEDSEDDDYDPAGPDSDTDIQEKQSSSGESADESDFTSDSDDFCAEIAKHCGQDEVSSGAKAKDPANDLEGATIHANTAKSNLIPSDLEMNQDLVLPLSSRRQVQRLDYKTLYDETYGEASSDSSDGEEWFGKSTPGKDDEEHAEAEPSACKSSRGSLDEHQSSEFTPQSARPSLHHNSFHMNEKHAGDQTCNGSNSSARGRHFEPIVNQRLHEHFKTDQYPSRAAKESLAQELGLTFRQVNKWFESTRHHTRVAANRGSTHLENHSTKRNRSSVVAHVEVTEYKDTMVEKPTVCKKDAANEDLTSTKLNEGIKQDNPVKQDIGSEKRTHAPPPESSQGYTTTSISVGCPKGDSRENRGKNTSTYVGTPNDVSAEDHVLGLEQDEGSKSDDYSEPLKDKEKVDDLGLPFEDSEDDDYDPAGPDSDKEVGKSCGQDGVSSGAKAGVTTVILEGTSGQPDTPEEDNGKQSKPGSSGLKGSRRTGAVQESNESTPLSAQQSLHPDAFHGSVNAQHAQELTPDGSNSTAQRRHFGPIINQRLHEHFKTDQYPSRAVKESLARELGLTFLQVDKWFDRTRKNARVAATKNNPHLENHGTKRNSSSVIVCAEVTNAKQTMMEKPAICKIDVAIEDMASGSLNDGIKQDSSVKQDIGSGKITGFVGEPSQNHGKNATPKYGRRPKDGRAQDVVLALEVVDEATKIAFLRGLKKTKVG